jgi:hypothetical protein
MFCPKLKLKKDILLIKWIGVYLKYWLALKEGRFADKFRMQLNHFRIKTGILLINPPVITCGGI